MRVLVVEDEVRLAHALERGLRAEGFGVDLAHDGESGLHLASGGGYDAVVLDIMLPKLSGYRVVERLRHANNWVPILLLSAKDGEYDQADGLDVGADDYLTKPFSYVVLVARLRALLRRGAPERPTILRAGDLELDPATHVVRRGESDISLTPREFSLLDYLLRRRGEVVSKRALLEHVWNSLRRDRSQRRRGLHRLPAAQDRHPVRPPGRQTVRGAGYRLAADGG